MCNLRHCFGNVPLPSWSARVFYFNTIQKVWKKGLLFGIHGIIRFKQWNLCARHHLILNKSAFYQHSVFMVSYISQKKQLVSLKSVNELIFVMMKSSVFFAVSNEFSNII
jgi:hypothetical protein